MEALGILAAILLLVIVIGVPYLLVSHARLKSDLRALEGEQRRLSTRLRNLESGAPVREPTEASETTATPPEADAARPRPEDVGPWAAVSKAIDNAPVSDDAADPPGAADAPVAPLPQDPSDAQAGGPQRAVVFTPDRAQALGAWLRQNWALAIAGLSLALAGVFMVQYGVEQGLLTPVWRVAGALALGAALVVAGEVLRRRFGDDDAGAAQALPSILAGAGLVSLFAGILAARALYGLIGPGPALIGLGAVSVLAVLLGWVYGPVFAAGGIIGASAAPFLVGGQSDTPWLFYYYFALIGFAGLAVDTVKRWAWVSAIVLIATVTGAALLYLGGAGALHLAIFMVLLTAMATIIPARQLIPRHSGTPVLAASAGRRPFPEFPTRLASAMVTASAAAGVILAVDAPDPGTAWLAIALLTALGAMTLIWMARAPGLEDLALPPALALLAVVALEAFWQGPLHAEFRAAISRLPEMPPPRSVSALVGLGALLSGLAFWRMLGASSRVAQLLWALGAAVFAPALVLILEFLWHPAPVLGAYPWALHGIALAAVMTVLAERTARAPDRAGRPLRVALFALAALTLIALALFLLLSKTALTLALAVMVPGTALIDRRYNLPLLGGFIQLGVAVIAYRLIFDPGLFWAIERAGTGAVLLAYLGPILLMAAAWKVLAHRPASAARIVLESGVWTIAAVLACVLLFHLFDDTRMETHWGLGLLAAIWFAAAAAQLYRLQTGGRLFRVIRIGLAGLFGLIGALCALGPLVWANPLGSAREAVLGPPVLDSLAVAYLPLAAVFAVAAWRLVHLPRLLRLLFGIASAGFGAIYVGLEIRRLWRGPDLSVTGVTQPELYSYTIAMLVVAVGLLLVAFWRRSVPLRMLAMAGVALTIAKVFLVDMAGLTGLIRVASFLGLGLGLAGLAWLNRRMAEQWEGDAAEEMR